MGADGHVGSIYPDSEQLSDASGATVLALERPDKMSITLSLRTINAALHVVVAATGAKKAPVVAKALAKDPAVPGGRVNPAQGTLTWLLDEPAAADLSTK